MPTRCFRPVIHRRQRRMSATDFNECVLSSRTAPSVLPTEVIQHARLVQLAAKTALKDNWRGPDKSLTDH